MKHLNPILSILLIIAAPASAQVRPGVFTTINTTDTSATSICAGCAVGSAAATGGVKAGSVVDSVGSMATIRSSIHSTWAGGSSGQLSASASSTTYWGFFSGAPGAEITDEGLTKLVVPYSGTVKNFYVRVDGAQPASGSLVFTVRKNGADTSLTVTLAASGATQTLSDTTHSFTVVAGDLLSLKVVNNASAGSLTIRGYSMEIDTP